MAEGINDRHPKPWEWERDGYYIHWSGWIPSPSWSRYVSHWLAWPQSSVEGYQPGSPHLCVVCGAYGEGWYVPGSRFDLRPHPDVPPLTPSDWKSPEGLARVDAEFERGRRRINEFVDIVTRNSKLNGKPMFGQGPPQMRSIIMVPVDAETGELIRDEVG